MMQSYASTAKLRSGGPILPFGMTAMSHLGTPPPRTVGDPSQAGIGPKLLGAFSDLRSLRRRAQNDAVRYHALSHETP